MANYESNPSVTTVGAVRLYGNEYRLLDEAQQDGTIQPGKVQVVLSTTPPPKFVTGGDYGKDDQPTLSTQSWSDLTGGAGCLNIRSAEDLTKLWRSQNMNTLYPGSATLGPLVTDISRPSITSDAIPASVGTLGGTLFVCFWSIGTGAIYLYSHNDTTWSAELGTVASQQVQENATEFNSRLFYPGSTSGYFYHNSAGTITDVAQAAMSFTVWDNKIYLVDSVGGLYSSTTGNAASWGTVLATLPLDALPSAAPQLKLVVHDDADGDPAIWCLTDIGPFVFDAAASKWMRARFQIPTTNRSHFQDSFGTSWRGDLFARTGIRKQHRLSMKSGTLEVAPVDVARDGVTNVDGYTPSALEASNSYLLGLMTWHSTSNSLNNIGVGLNAYNGIGWHMLYWQVGTATRQKGQMRAVYIFGEVRLYFPLVGSSVGWIRLDELEYAHIAAITTGAPRYASTGLIETPWFNAQFAAQRKTAVQCRLKLLGASADETVQIAYRIDGSTSAYTNLGSPVTANTEQTIEFGTNSVGLAFKSIQFQLTFVRGSTNTNAPKMEYFALDYIRVPEPLRGFIITLDCRAPWGQRSSRQQIDDLWTAIETDTLGTFALRDDSTVGSSNTRSYLVKITRPEGLENTGRDESGIYKLLLVSYGDN